MNNITGYLIVCVIGVACVAWWWKNKRETAWEYTAYVAVILALTSLVVLC